MLRQRGYPAAPLPVFGCWRSLRARAGSPSNHSWGSPSFSPQQHLGRSPYRGHAVPGNPGQHAAE